MATEKMQWWKKFLPASEGVTCLFTMAVVIFALVKTQPAERDTPNNARGSAVTNVVNRRSLEPSQRQDLPASVRVVSHTSAK